MKTAISLIHLMSKKSINPNEKRRRTLRITVAVNTEMANSMMRVGIMWQEEAEPEKEIIIGMVRITCKNGKKGRQQKGKSESSAGPPVRTRTDLSP